MIGFLNGRVKKAKEALVVLTNLIQYLGNALVHWVSVGTEMEQTPVSKPSSEIHTTKQPWPTESLGAR